MKNKNDWKQYPVEISANDIQSVLFGDLFTSEGKQFELLRFYKNPGAPNVLITPGTSGHMAVSQYHNY